MSAPPRKRVPWVAAAALACLGLIPPGASRAATATASDRLDELMQLLSARRHGRVTFTEVQHLAILDRPLESSGELLYDAPDRLEKRTLRPVEETLVLAHGVLTATRGRHSHSVELAAHPEAAPLVESIRATLAGDRAALERVFSVALDGDLAHWTLTLAPRDSAAAHAVREVRITGARAGIATVEILQADGDRSVLTLGPEASS
ncbi:MAG TPA: LolA-related protein [Steroidobacteraceae bacterium]|nr:LolA-related protein [Steroidobacteraceae bacterium]